MLTTDLEVVTISAFKAFHYAQGIEPNWEHEGLDVQGNWERLCRRIEALLESQEGKSWPEVAHRLYEAWYLERFHLPFNETERTVQCAWEAVARHLMAFADEAEISNLDEMERSWGPWLKKKLQSPS